jgi:hypothetical protein
VPDGHQGHGQWLIAVVAGNGPFPATGIPLVVGLSAANTRIPLARWINLAGAPGGKDLWSLFSADYHSDAPVDG